MRWMDIIPEAIEDANTMPNGWDLRIPTMRLGQQEIIPRWYQEGYRTINADRGSTPYGLGDKLIETLLHYAPEKMVLCPRNVSTLARSSSFDEGLSG